MNYSIIRYILGKVIALEGLFMLLPAGTGLVYGEWKGMCIYLAFAALLFAVGSLIEKRPVRNKLFYAREGYVIAAVSWLVMSILGALPFVVSGDIPFYVDALFEIISGFTTTGASILSDPSELLHCNLLWRSFSHWIGGMGVLVFLIALMPAAGGENMFLMRAESPGPSVGKIVPRIQQTSKILYGIYAGLTLLMFVLLVAGRMPVFDAVCIAVGTAGTGGYGVLADSCASYNTYLQVVITVFMLLFGVNFSFYYLLLIKKTKDALKMEEVRGYFILYAAATLCITLNLWAGRGSFFGQLQQVAFQTASVVTTTGFSTVDFDAWPMFSKILMGVLMIVGGCSGSTAGGLKMSRILIYLKGIFNEIAMQVHPNHIKTLSLDGKKVVNETVRATFVYLSLFVLIFIASVVLISLDNCDWETSFSAVLATINNIGPGFGGVGASCNFSLFSPFSKGILMFDMLAGRLELLPILVMIMPATWRRNG